MEHQAISIHALREEGDWCTAAAPGKHRNFYPRPPRGGRLLRGYSGKTIFEFLSTPSARRATHFGPMTGLRIPISIHALREEGDNRNSGNCNSGNRFLSTPSARRATAKTEKNISAFVSL